MRWITIGLVGALAGLIAWQSGALFEPQFDSGMHGTDAFTSVWYDMMIFAIFAPLLIAVMSGTLAVFRALWLSTRRAELASLIALGRTRRSLIGDHVRAGLFDGLIASAGIVVVGAIRQAVTGLSNAKFVPFVAANYGVIFGVVLASFVLAYWIAAAWATRGSVRDVAAGHRADARAGSTKRGKRRLGRRVWLWVAIAALLAGATAVTLSSWGGSTDGGSTTVTNVVGVIAGVIFTVAAYLGVPGLLAFVGAKIAVRFARTVSRWIAAPAHPGSARSLAEDGLSQPTGLRTAAATAVVAVMGVAVATTATTFASYDEQSVAGRLVPAAYISTVELEGFDESREGTESGWSPPLPQDLVDELHADPALMVIEAGVLVTDTRDVSEPRAVEPYTGRDRLLAVNPTALDTVVPDAWKRLYLVDGTQWQNGSLGVSYQFSDRNVPISVNGESTEVVSTHGNAPWVGVSRTWAEGVWGPVPTSAVLLYPAEDESTERGSMVFTLHDHDLRGYEVTQGPPFGWRGPTSSNTMAAVTAPFLAIAVGLVIALAWSGQRLRARDHATLLALGATPAALRWATALESGILTLAAATVGVAGGALIGPVWAASNSVPWGVASTDLVLWNIGQNLAIVPWTVAIGLALGAAGIAAAGAALIRVRLDRLSPAQQLTEAQKAGVS